MEIDVQKFTAAVVSVVVVVILGVTVLIPIINSNKIPEGTANKASLDAMISIVPLLVFVGIIVAVVAMFLGRNKN